MKVVSAARKLILQPQAGAPVVAFPAGAKVNDYGAGNANPSIVVMNGTEAEPSWQGVDNATGVVIANLVPEEVANAVLDIFDAGGRTNDALNQALSHLTSNGCLDQYTTPYNFVDTQLSPAGRMLDRYTGIVKRDNRDQVEVWREGDVFHVFTDGDRVIEPDILVATYRNPDGSEIDLDTVPEKA